jgi:hypothetical protein
VDTGTCIKKIISIVGQSQNKYRYASGRWSVEVKKKFRWTFFLIFKGLGLLKLKTSDLRVLMHFIVAWSVNVEAATNFHGSGVRCYHYCHCYSLVCNNDDILLSGRQRQVGTAENQREIIQRS